MGVIPLASQEIGAIATAYPLYFGENQARWYVFTDLSTGPVVLDGKGRLSTKVRPFLVRTYPFTALCVAGSWALGVFDDPGYVSATGRPFFDGQAPTQTVSRLSKHMARFLEGMKRAGALVKTLSDAGVLRCDQPADASGWSLWQVDEAKLADLEPQALETVYRNGALALGYTQLVSQIHLRSPAATQRVPAIPTEKQQSDAFLESILDDIDDQGAIGMGSLIK